MRHRIVVREVDGKLKAEIEFDSSLAQMPRETQSREVEDVAFRASELVKRSLVSAA